MVRNEAVLDSPQDSLGRGHAHHHYVVVVDEGHRDRLFGQAPMRRKYLPRGVVIPSLGVLTGVCRETARHSALSERTGWP